MVAVQITRVLPKVTMQDPAGCMIISLSKVTLLTFDSQFYYFLFIWFAAVYQRPVTFFPAYKSHINSAIAMSALICQTALNFARCSTSNLNHRLDRCICFVEKFLKSFGQEHYNYLFGSVLFRSMLIQNDHIPADNAQYIFFLHCRNNSRVEALG